MKRILLLLLVLLPFVARGQVTSKQIRFDTANPTVCAGGVQYNNTTTGDIFERLGASGTTCTKIVSAAGASGSSTAVTVTGTSGAGFVQIANQSTAPGTPTSSGRIYFDTNGKPAWIDTAGTVRNFTNTQSFLMGNLTATTVNASTTNYGNFSTFSASAIEGGRFQVIPAAGVIKNLYLTTATTQDASGALVVTLRVNGVDTALTFTVAANAPAGTFSDTTHSVTVAAGDKITVALVNAATAASAQLVGISALVQ